MKKQWIVGLALLVAPIWAAADDMGKKDSGKAMMAAPAATMQATPVAQAKKVKKTKKSPKKPMADTGKMGTDRVTGTAKAASPAAAIKKSYTCPMDGGHYDHGGKCPKCGMDLVEEKS